MEGIKISLAKALKLKNRLAGRLAAANRDVAEYNSVLVAQKDNFSVEKALKLHSELISALVELKTSIYKGNVSIQRELYLLSETKSEIQLYSSLNTRDGVEKHGYANSDVEYFAFLKKQDVDDKVKKLEAEVDRLQDVVDEYNHTCKIEVAQRTLDLAS